MTRRLRALHRWAWPLLVAATLWILTLALEHRPSYPDETRDTAAERP